MIRSGFLWSIISILTILNSFGSSARQDEVNVLVIFAFSPTNPVYQLIIDGIRQPLLKEYGDDLNLHTEYLEKDRFQDEENMKKRIELYNEKYLNVEIDLLICVGVDAIGPIKKYADKYFLNLKAINLDFDFSRYGIQMDKYLNEKTTYIGLELKPALTISSALENFPNTKTVYFVSGSAKTDVIYRLITREVLKSDFPTLETVFLADMTMDKILVEVSRIPVNSLILFASYNSDSRGLPFYSSDAIRMIRMASKVPIFSYSDLGFGEGPFGGQILSFHKAGLFTGTTAINLLQTTDPELIRVNRKDFYTYQFDWRELARFNIDERDVQAKDYKMYFKSENFVNKHKWVIVAVFLFLFLQTFFIIKLIFSHRRQKIMIRQIREAENKFREFTHEDRILRMGQLTASLSHELIQPLTAILSTAQAGVRFIDSDKSNPQLLKEILGNIIEDDKRTTSILRSIQGMMKLEDREKEKTDLNSIILEVITIFHSEAIDNNIKLILQLPDNPVFVYTDKVQIQQVILNFLLNARQALENSGGKEKTITITESQDSESVSIAVYDNGKGIEANVREKLFKPFVSSKKKGLGIGLSICRTIIEEHQGRIWAENVPEGGAKFSFSLKIYKNGKEEL